MSNDAGGTLWVVATPIGNAEDLGPRAVGVLRAVAVVAAEDTRHTGAFLQRLGVNTPLQSLHEHNERERVAELLERLAAGEDVALVSDAGTPLISDPGYRLVRAAAERGMDVRTVPGPSAVTAALSVAGLPTDRFVFEGFLPARAPARRRRFEELVAEPRTLVFFEASHRVRESVADAAGAFGGDRRAVLARELTKRFETVLRGTLRSIGEALEADPDQRRGEFVLVVAGAEPAARDPEAGDVDGTLRTLLGELPVKQAVRLAARLTGAARNRLYQRALELRDEGPE